MGLLAAVEKRFAARKGKKTTRKGGRHDAARVHRADARRRRKPQTTVYFIKDNVLVGVDDRAEAEAMLKRFAGNATDNLKSVPAYTATMERCREKPAAWSRRPAGSSSRSASSLPPARCDKTTAASDQDIAKILVRERLRRHPGRRRLRQPAGRRPHRVPARARASTRRRWRARKTIRCAGTCSMRMLQLPNGPAVEPQSWVPRMMASYTTLNMKLTRCVRQRRPAVRRHSGSRRRLEELARRLEERSVRPAGGRPQGIHRQHGQPDHGDDRATTRRSPRTASARVFAIEATNEKALAKTLEKWMSNEPDVERREVGPVRHLGTRAEGPSGRRAGGRGARLYARFAPAATRSRQRRRRARAGAAELGRDRCAGPPDDGLRHRIPDRDPGRLRPARAAGEQRRLSAGARRS